MTDLIKFSLENKIYQSDLATVTYRFFVRSGTFFKALLIMERAISGRLISLLND